MDTTEQNIKMCEKADNIQKLWLPRIGDCFVYKVPMENTYELHWLGGENTNKILLKKHKLHGPLIMGHQANRCIWLPRQDQLQEMISDDWRKFFSDFMWFYQDENTDTYYSMEQLWLAFVMSKRHSKIWDGNNWVIKEK
jgi:hypothetical protein